MTSQYCVRTLSTPRDNEMQHKHTSSTGHVILYVTGSTYYNLWNLQRQRKKNSTSFLLILWATRIEESKKKC